MNSELMQLLSCFGSVRLYNNYQEWRVIFTIKNSGIESNISSEYCNTPEEAEKSLLSIMKSNNINFVVDDKIIYFHELLNNEIKKYLKIVKKNM